MYCFYVGDIIYQQESCISRTAIFIFCYFHSWCKKTNTYLVCLPYIILVVIISRFTSCCYTIVLNYTDSVIFTGCIWQIIKSVCVWARKHFLENIFFHVLYATCMWVLICMLHVCEFWYVYLVCGNTMYNLLARYS